MNPQPTIARLNRRCRPWKWSVVALIVLAAGVTTARAQSAPATDVAQASDVEIKVTDASMRGPLISVPVNRGVLVDFSVPIREVRIANPDIADVAVTSPQQILVHGKSFGTTQLFAKVDNGAQKVFTVAVDLDLERLQASIRANVPRAQVEAKALLDSVVVSGTVPDTESADRIMQIAHIYSDKVINQMRVAGVQQVLLRVTVAEVNRTATRQLGFNGWMAGDDFQDGFLVNNLNGINPSNIGAAADVLATARIPFAVGQDGIPITGAPTISVGFPRVQMQLFIQALRRNGLLTVLAEPNLVTVSGQEATFLAGGEIPYPAEQGTSGSVTIEFREYGVRLSFTPTVLSQNAIRMHVAPEVSEPDFSTSVQIAGFVVPGLSQRRIDTHVELAPGQTFAIGGLLSETTRSVVSKVPALGDLPVLGALFTSSDFQTSETELVILVTPELVQPLNPNQVNYIPGADIIPPNDWELFALGKLEGEGGAPDKEPPPRTKNNWPAKPEEQYGPAAALRLRGPIGPAGGGEGL